jgi:hypothetical protein
MPPSDNGLTRTDAEGAKRRWRPRTLLGRGGGGGIFLDCVDLGEEFDVRDVELLSTFNSVTLVRRGLIRIPQHRGERGIALISPSRTNA